jgi:low affinity Fe/Cu permease
MTLNEKIALFIITSVCIISAIIIVPLKNKLATYESALDNTVDATIMEIDEHKNIIKGERLKIANKCKNITKNLPHRFVQDGTCEL